MVDQSPQWAPPWYPRMVSFLSSLWLLFSFLSISAKVTAGPLMSKLGFQVLFAGLASALWEYLIAPVPSKRQNSIPKAFGTQGAGGLILCCGLFHWVTQPHLPTPACKLVAHTWPSDVFWFMCTNKKLKLEPTLRNKKLSCISDPPSIRSCLLAFSEPTNRPLKSHPLQYTSHYLFKLTFSSSVLPLTLYGARDLTLLEPQCFFKLFVVKDQFKKFPIDCNCKI